MIGALLLAAALGVPGDALSVFSGHWRVVGDVNAADGKTQRRLVFDQQCAWTPRKAYLICEQNGKTEQPRTAELTLIWWDPNARTYRFSSFGMGGFAADGKITIEGPVWTWASGLGVTMFRTTNRFVRPGLVEFQSERSTNGGASWSVQARGTETRA